MMKLVAALAATALAATTIATPAEAGRRHRHHHHDEVTTGDAIVGAVVAVGVLALFAGANKEEKRLKQDAAVGACSEEAEYRTRGHVSEIFSVGKRKGYWTVQGALEGEGGGEAGSFTCTVRNGRIYKMQLSGDAA